MIKTVLHSAAALAMLSQVASASMNFVFGEGSFATAPGPGGASETGRYSGFSLIRDDGTTIWDGSTVNDYSPCFNNGGGSRIEASSDCWEGPITFSCMSDFGGVPESCSADYEFNHFPGEADKDTDFIGIAISIQGHCGGNVNVDVSECTADNANMQFNYPTLPH